ncbi:hypothetical protein KC318_g17005 [Hortaea werneckii]|nr:hypothetical protein KC334_g17000 [Hortaea werneckii]KAI6923577.1 hypothetical protein KC355_g16970 [Hortaea werneckii]KAI7649668.1 hypothetical protein KC318_g17005 [Hortaea werneckii]
MSATKQGATLSTFYSKQCSKTANCDFIVVFGKPGAIGASYCQAGSAGPNSCADDGHEQVGPKNLKRRRNDLAPASNAAMYRLASGREISGPMGLDLDATVSRIASLNATLYEEQIASHISPNNDDEDGPGGDTDGGNDVHNGDGDGDEFDYMLDNMEVIEDPIVEIL